jgi:hypothetical protein
MEPKKIETLIHRASPLLAALVASLALGACGTFQPRQGRTIERIGTELDAGIADRKARANRTPSRRRCCRRSSSTCRRPMAGRSSRAST